ncbi:MAG: hypothetical protein QNI95_02365 [Desulfobacterales bacterium]|nr:hypothetical protein [Desulfobacterales bacterium]
MLLELIITFAVMLFTAFSVTFGILIGRRTPGHTCHSAHGEAQDDREEIFATCGACRKSGN